LYIFPYSPLFSTYFYAETSMILIGILTFYPYLGGTPQTPVTAFESAAISSDAEARVAGLVAALRVRAERLVPLAPVAARLLVKLPLDEPPILLLGNDHCTAVNATHLLMATDSLALVGAVGEAQPTAALAALVERFVTASRGELSPSTAVASGPVRDMPFYDRRGGGESSWSKTPGMQAADMARLSRVTHGIVLPANPAVFRISLQGNGQAVSGWQLSPTAVATTFLADSEGFAAPPAVMGETGPDTTFSSDEVRVAVPPVGPLAASIAIFLDADRARDRLEVAPAAAPAAMQVAALRGLPGDLAALAQALTHGQSYLAAALKVSHISQTAAGRSPPCHSAFDPDTAASTTSINVLGSAPCVSLCVNIQCGARRTPIVTLILDLSPDAPAAVIVAAVDAAFAASGLAVRPGLPFLWQVYSPPRPARILNEGSDRRRSATWTFSMASLAHWRRQESAGTSIAVALLPYGDTALAPSAADVVAALQANGVQASSEPDPIDKTDKESELPRWAIGVIAMGVVAIVGYVAFRSYSSYLKRRAWDARERLRETQMNKSREQVEPTVHYLDDEPTRLGRVNLRPATATARRSVEPFSLNSMTVVGNDDANGGCAGCHVSDGRSHIGNSGSTSSNGADSNDFVEADVNETWV
jgi:hypothetical protein